MFRLPSAWLWLCAHKDITQRSDGFLPGPQSQNMSELSTVTESEHSFRIFSKCIETLLKL